jgi:hypothetical protein
MTPSGIEPATFRFVAQYLNHCAPAVLQAWSGPEGSRKLRFPDYMTTAQDGSKVVSLKHRPPLPPGNAHGTHFCQRLSRPQGHSVIGRIISMKNSNDTIWNRTSDLPICSTVVPPSAVPEQYIINLLYHKQRSLLHVSPTHCGHLQGGVLLKDIIHGTSK